MGGGGKGRKRQSMDGFRPGKEPGHLKKRRARARLGEDASWAQKKMIDAVGDQSPEEVRSMVKRWTGVLLSVALALAVGGGLLYLWSTIAGVAVHALALGVAFLWFRLRSKREEFVKTAEWVQRG